MTTVVEQVWGTVQVCWYYKFSCWLNTCKSLQGSTCIYTLKLCRISMITDYLETSIVVSIQFLPTASPLNSPECPIPWFMQVCCPPKKNKSLLKLTIVYYIQNYGTMKLWFTLKKHIPHIPPLFDRKDQAKEYTPSSGAVNTPVLASYPFPLFNNTTSNLSALFIGRFWRYGLRLAWRYITLRLSVVHSENWKLNLKNEVHCNDLNNTSNVSMI